MTLDAGLTEEVAHAAVVANATNANARVKPAPTEDATGATRALSRDSPAKIACGISRLVWDPEGPQVLGRTVAATFESSHV